jgi:hypothetical protein
MPEFDLPPSVITDIVKFGLAAPIIIALAWAWLRADNRLTAVQEARISDRDRLQEKHEAENLKTAESIDRLTQALRALSEESGHRWNISENMASILEDARAEITRIGRLVDANTIRIEDIQTRARE